MMNVPSVLWSRSRMISVAAGLVCLVLVAIWPKVFDKADISFGRLNTSRKPLQTAIAINNRRLGFQRIFAINLPERSDHRDGLVLAAAVSGIDIDFVPGVKGSDVPVIVLPADHNPNHPIGAVGSWRAHINVIRRIVTTGLSTAMIMEDDIDWDVRLRDLLQNFAIASNTVLNDPGSEEMGFDSLARTVTTSTAPYGDDWDVLWLGHCGMDIARDRTRVVHEDDVSVPQTQYLESWDPAATSPMVNFANHTRLTGFLAYGVCSLAYAVSQSAARQILYEIGMEHLDMPYDLMLGRFCEHARCIGVLPQLFDHHRKKGSQRFRSDINENHEPDRPIAKTNNIRFSVRMNIERVLRGQQDWKDQFPDV